MKQKCCFTIFIYHLALVKFLQIICNKISANDVQKVAYLLPAEGYDQMRISA